MNRTEHQRRVESSLRNPAAIPRAMPGDDAADRVMRAIAAESRPTSVRHARDPAGAWRFIRPAAVAAALILTAAAILALPKLLAPATTQLTTDQHSTPAAPQHIAAAPEVAAADTPAAVLSRAVRDLRARPGEVMVSAISRPIEHETQGLARQASLSAKFLIDRLPDLPSTKQ